MSHGDFTHCYFNTLINDNWHQVSSVFQVKFYSARQRMQKPLGKWKAKPSNREKVTKQRRKMLTVGLSILLLLPFY